MKFCSKCNNMYYLSISEENENKLIYYCRNCGHQNNEINIPGTMSVSNIQIVEDTTNMSHIINKYTKLDSPPNTIPKTPPKSIDNHIPIFA